MPPVDILSVTVKYIELATLALIKFRSVPIGSPFPSGRIPMSSALLRITRVTGIPTGAITTLDKSRELLDEIGYTCGMPNSQ